MAAHSLSMRDPEKFVTFVLGAFMLLYYLGIGAQIVRVWHRIGRSPVTAFSKGSPGEKFRAGGAALWPLVVLAWAHCPLCFRGVPHLPLLENWPARMAGLLCLCLGTAIAFVAYAELGDSWRVGTDPEAPPVLIQTGIYSAVRHPVYAAGWLWFLGIFLLAPNLLFVLLWGLGSALFLFQARREEDFLCAKLGKTYREYMRFTGGFFPLWF